MCKDHVAYTLDDNRNWTSHPHQPRTDPNDPRCDTAYVNRQIVHYGFYRWATN